MYKPKTKDPDAEDPDQSLFPDPSIDGKGITVKMIVTVWMTRFVMTKSADVMKKEMSHSKESAKGMQESFCYFPYIIISHSKREVL